VDAWNAAFEQNGYERITDFLAEQKTVGTRAYTAAIDPVSGHRSSADTQYGALLAGRDNVMIMTGATVQRILFEKTPQGTVRAIGVEVNVDGRLTTLEASREIILAAGVFRSPKLLELSGIGNASRLHELGIHTLVDLPGVGENLQNHIIAGLPVGLKPHPMIQGITPGIKAFAFVSLDSEAKDQLWTTTDSAAEEPQSSTIRSILQSPDEASAIIGLSVISDSLSGLGIGLTFPFSKGSSHIKSTDPGASPRFDAGFLTNKLDLEILVRHVQQAIRFLSSSTALGPFFHECQIPSDRTALEGLLRASLTLPAHHSCGTAAMLPREKGGVVGDKLKVYGTENLRIVDASVFPLISNTNPMCLVYAVAEKAADFIKGV
jgi:choline dehydrogenase-like flavoprotein